jgi:hypothetical protein
VALVSGQLRHVGDEGGAGPERCVVCGGVAVGPCATCRRPVCGDCCELSQGGVRTWAVCLRCARLGSGALARGWVAVLLWVLGPALVLLAIAAAIMWLRH